MALIPINEAITGDIVDACIQIHRDLGPGLLESVYELLLYDELTRRGRVVQRQLELPLTYRGRHLEHGFRVDLLIDSAVIVEIKVTDRVAPVHADLSGILCVRHIMTPDRSRYATQTSGFGNR